MFFEVKSSVYELVNSAHTGRKGRVNIYGKACVIWVFKSSNSQVQGLSSRLYFCLSRCGSRWRFLLSMIYERGKTTQVGRKSRRRRKVRNLFLSLVLFFLSSLKAEFNSEIHDRAHDITPSCHAYFEKMFQGLIHLLFNVYFSLSQFSFFFRQWQRIANTDQS